MTAQYKPYRDEESVDGLETTSWTDNEPGSIQIYEKTTEELPFNSVNKRSVWIHTAFYLATMILGFLLGYIMHFHPHEPSAGDGGAQSLPVTNFFHEDPTIKDKLLAKIGGNNIRNTLNEFADIDRKPGSVGDHLFAAHVREEFIAAGLGPVIPMNYTFKTMLPTKHSILHVLDKDNKTIYTTNSTNAILPLSQADETTIVTNQLMYMNKGLKEDYTKLKSLGLSNDTEGKVFVIRQTFYQAHDVITTAQESGAKAILLFPDPDTYGDSSPFPHSVQLPADAAKSHPQAWSNYGDLASLNLSSLVSVDVSKLGIDKESKVLIPVVPISFNDARELLVGLSGTPAPKEWNCFDFTLHIGPGYKEDNGFDGRDKIRLDFFNQETTLTTTTITGVLAGSAETDRYIVLGSRRDSLNKGVLDSVSGTAVMLEIARVFGELVKEGWRPKRTIVFNSFGAESLNLVGSTNWLGNHQRLLHSRAVAYINCDLVVTGNQTVTIAASPLLYHVLYNSTRQVEDPNDRSSSVYDSWKRNHERHKFDEIKLTIPRDYQEFGEVKDQLDTATKHALESGSSTASGENQDVLGYRGDILAEYKKSATARIRPKVRRLDLQSIYSPFLLYSGIPVVDVRYTGFPNVKNSSGLIEDTLPLLGTKYDTMATVQRIDPHQEYHVAVAKILSEILRDLSDSVYLPFNLLDYAVALRDSYAYLARHYGKTFNDSNLELGKSC